MKSHVHYKKEDQENKIFKIQKVSEKKPNRSLIIGAVILVLIIIVLILTLPKNCKSNSECFFEESKTCSKVKADLEKDKDIMRYEILGKKTQTCVLKVTKIKVSDEKSRSIKEALEGRNMECAVPLSIMKESKITEISNINDYCTGSLKELILEISLQKMYEMLIKDIGNITLALQDVIKELKR